MKLNYDIKMPPKTEEEKTKDFKAKNRTKLSMQGVVGQALAEKMPQAPAGPVGSPAPNNAGGWGRNA